MGDRAFDTGHAIVHGAHAEAPLVWADELVVFAELDQKHTAVAQAQLRAVPYVMEVEVTDILPSLILNPQRVGWQPGESINLEKYIDASAGDLAAGGI